MLFKKVCQGEENAYSPHGYDVGKPAGVRAGF